MTDDLRNLLRDISEAHLKSATQLERLELNGVIVPRFQGEQAATLTIRQLIIEEHEAAERYRVLLERLNWDG